MSPLSCLYAGRVIHTRTRPRRHALRYRVFWLLLDLDEIDALDARLRLFSRNRFNLLSFHDSDHGNGSAPGQGPALRSQIEALLREAGIDPAGGRIALLCMPRMLGYVFNPISVYFCYAPSGALTALVYEVTSTFKVRHSYVIPVEAASARSRTIRQTCRKRLYVSPFIDMDLDYDFQVLTPERDMALTVRGTNAQGLLISAVMTGQRTSLSDGSIARAALTHPLLTLKVVAGIHWEALKLWLKGVPLTRQPPPPQSSYSIVAPASADRSAADA